MIDIDIKKYLIDQLEEIMFVKETDGDDKGVEHINRLINHINKFKEEVDEQ